MDLLDSLRKRVDSLPDGEYISGLRAVQRHIEAAFGHMQRGQDSGDESAYTDAIYRANHAFEGSIKEAYRVMAGKQPERMRLFDIESYLETNKVFRPRILFLFTNYRTEWRNPSAHDYTLDFDDCEALLAIVSVTTFACLLTNQIAERLAFEASNADTMRLRKKEHLSIVDQRGPLASRMANALLEFARNQAQITTTATHNYSQVIGQVCGYLAAISSKGHILTELPLFDGQKVWVDLAVREGDDLVIIELKLVKKPALAMSTSIAQLEHYMVLTGTTASILYFAGPAKPNYELTTYHVPHDRGVIYIIAPARTGVRGSQSLSREPTSIDPIQMKG